MVKKVVIVLICFWENPFVRCWQKPQNQLRKKQREAELDAKRSDEERAAIEAEKERQRQEQVCGSLFDFGQVTSCQNAI